MDTSQITKLFKDVLNETVTSVVDKSKGVDQEVKLVTTNSGTFVLKIPHKEKDKILKEIVATKECAKLGISVPKVLYSNEDLLIQTCIEGVDLSDSEFTKQEYENIYFELGQILRKIHSITGSGFGHVKSNELVGEWPSQKENVDSWFSNEIEEFAKVGIYSSKDMDKIRKYYRDNVHFYQTANSVLQHWDLTDNNIMVNQNGVTGIIDFADICIGPASWDFAAQYMSHYGEYKFDKLLEGYGDHNIEEIRFYAFCRMCWLCRHRLKEKKFGERTAAIQKRFEDIWK